VACGGTVGRRLYGADSLWPLHPAGGGLWPRGGGGGGAKWVAGARDAGSEQCFDEGRHVGSLPIPGMASAAIFKRKTTPSIGSEPLH
jgi:hypothetical protein